MTTQEFITADLIPIIPLTIMTNSGVLETVEAVVDTGFNGNLTLSSDLIQQLGLTLWGTGRTMLGDGQIVDVNLYIAHIFWQGHNVIVTVEESQSGAPWSVWNSSWVTL